jgi:hypothetical protein
MRGQFAVDKNSSEQLEECALCSLSFCPGKRLQLHLIAVRCVQFDSRSFANGNYELFVQATTPSGLKSHPNYGDEMEHFDAAVLSGAYYPIPIAIQN